MSNLFDESSLAMIPTAYKEDKLYSLRPTDGSGDFTFSRGSNLAATRVGADGLIEKGRENKLLNSNEWTLSNSGYEITGGESGYDGTNNAWLVNSLTGSYFNRTSIIISGVETFSIYVKAGSLDRFFIFYGGDSARFDLTNVTSTKTGGSLVDHSIESVGSGWYRCSLTFNRTATQNLLMKPQDSSNQSVAGTVYIQAGQLEKGLVATPYIETGATTAQAGILENTPRLDYSGGATCPSLLLEPSRTNAVPYSEYINGLGIASSGTGTSTITENYLVSPEGVQNAARIQMSIVDTADLANYRLINTGVGITNGVTSQISFYAKSLTGSNQELLVYWSYAKQIVTLTSEWQRFEIPATGGSTGGVLIGTRGGTPNQYYAGGDANLDFALYGIQAEVGTYKTSYIPTYGVSQTRTVDNCRNLSAANVIGQSAGTIFSEFIPLESIGAQLVEIAGSTADRIFTKDQPNGAFRIDIDANGVGIVNYTSPNGLVTEGEINKFALTYSAAGYALYINGSKITSGTDPIVFGAPVDKVFLNRNIAQNVGNNNNAKHNELLIFPTALTDSECIALTTI